MVISYSCFHFGSKYYRPAASDGHCHNRLLRLKLSRSTLTTNVRPRLQQVLIGHRQCLITLLSGHPSVHSTRVHNSNNKAEKSKIDVNVLHGIVAATASFSFKVSNVRVRVVLCSWTVCMHRLMCARLAEYCVSTESYIRFLVRPTIS